VFVPRRKDLDKAQSCADVAPGLNPIIYRKAATSEGLRRFWQPYEDVVLIKLRLEGRCNRVAAERLGRKLSSVQHRVKRIGIARKVRLPYRRWSADDVVVLRAYWPTHTLVQLAAMLGTTVGSVAGKINRMGLMGTVPNKKAAERCRPTASSFPTTNRANSQRA
jgi:hypothetical protein